MSLGFLNINKPAGMSSHDVVGFVRHLLPRGVKVGHLGTLDPGACGVLPVAVGWATRTIQYFPPNSKSYRAEVAFGTSTDTDDAHGEVIKTSDVPALSVGDIESCCRRFLGRFEQIPPRVSAIHVEGRRAYYLSREGADFEMTPREVFFHKISVLSYENGRALIDVECGPGTYIRSFARDLGSMLGCCAHLSFLLRTRSGSFVLDSACALEDLRAFGLEPYLEPVEEVLEEALGRKAFVEGKNFQGNQEFRRVWDEEGKICSLGEISQAWPVFERSSGRFIGVGTAVRRGGGASALRLERLLV
ncbi:tRNA pseudouridine(55) synthase TruB [bacterium]|nr:tRNA pseudouridine(55) synthase TruB [bacterium]